MEHSDRGGIAWCTGKVTKSLLVQLLSWASVPWIL